MEERLAEIEKRLDAIEELEIEKSQIELKEYLRLTYFPWKGDNGLNKFRVKDNIEVTRHRDGSVTRIQTDDRTYKKE